MSNVLCVGLVCLDRFLIVNSYPDEDSDQQAKQAFLARGGNAGNNCTVLSQILGPGNVTFLGTFPRSKLCLNQFEFVLQDFKENGVRVHPGRPVREDTPWPG